MNIVLELVKKELERRKFKVTKDYTFDYNSVKVYLSFDDKASILRANMLCTDTGTSNDYEYKIISKFIYNSEYLEKHISLLLEDLNVFLLLIRS